MAGGQVRIGQLYAFVALDPADNTEGLCGFLAADGTWMPMVGADMAMVERLRPIAHRLARDSGAPVRLLRFVIREELEVIEP